MFVQSVCAQPQQNPTNCVHDVWYILTVPLIWIFRLDDFFFIYINPSRADPAPIRDPNLVIAVHADALVPHSAIPSASTVRTEE